MDVSQAVPLGLILNEAITNSIKYAFPDDRNGVIIYFTFQYSSAIITYSAFQITELECLLILKIKNLVHWV